MSELLVSLNHVPFDVLLCCFQAQFVWLVLFRVHLCGLHFYVFELSSGVALQLFWLFFIPPN